MTKDAKQKLNSSVEAEAVVRKPGVESSCVHIAQLYNKRQPEVARELTRHLLPGLVGRLGVRRFGD